ncbi:MAG: YkgJ family cysteine cluster protein [Armatimonadetes bacterium]|nr:YkgJ family cysteine cluster protein [Armatimonadota bacterium]
MRLQTDPRVVAKLAEEREEVNWRFRTFLKNAELEIGELDAIVHAHYENVASQIDCCACGNCCREVLPTLDNADVTRLAAALGSTPDEIIAQYATRNDDGDLTFNRRPCPFLVGNRCRVYEHRPDTCRSYPHLQKDEFVFRLAQAVSNCSICPISFNVYERLKAELWHRRDDVGEEE